MADPSRGPSDLNSLLVDFVSGALRRLRLESNTNRGFRFAPSCVSSPSIKCTACGGNIKRSSGVHSSNAITTASRLRRHHFCCQSTHQQLPPPSFFRRHRRPSASSCRNTRALQQRHSKREALNMTSTPNNGQYGASTPSNLAGSHLQAQANNNGSSQGGNLTRNCDTSSISFTDLREALSTVTQQQHQQQRSQSNTDLLSCSQQAQFGNGNNGGDDTSVDELAAYFDNMVHIPRKMSFMAEMMYT